MRHVAELAPSLNEFLFQMFVMDHVHPTFQTFVGKSSIIPQVLLEGIGHPILCTQPRRLAVVAVTSYVAKQRGVVLGEDEVGYHVGQDKMANDETQLLYATSGVLLKELKSHGIDAITKYKAVIIDEW